MNKKKGKPAMTAARLARITRAIEAALFEREREGTVAGGG